MIYQSTFLSKSWRSYNKKHFKVSAFLRTVSSFKNRMKKVNEFNMIMIHHSNKKKFLKTLEMYKHQREKTYLFSKVRKHLSTVADLK